MTTTTTTATTKQEVINSRIENIDIEKIKNNLIDFRDRQEVHNDRESEEFKSLKLSIQNEGIVTPIHLAETEKGLQIVDGRRRFLAAKQLGLKKIPAIILDKDQGDLAIISLIQNIHRKGLNSIEKAKGIIDLFELHGYNQKQVLENVKKLHLKIPVTDQEFNKIFARIGYSGNYTYILISILEYLPKDVIEESKKNQLGLRKNQLLTHTKLRQHPKIQKMLVEDIKDKSIKTAEIKVRQTIDDLESGVIYQDEKGSYHGGTRQKDQPSEQELKRPEIAKQPLQFYFELLDDNKKILRTLTGHTLARGEHKYLEKHIKTTEQHRKDLVASIDERSAFSLIEELSLIIKAMHSLMQLADERHYPE
jgi:ParB/RepB/Spo0J family partition protein